MKHPPPSTSSESAFIFLHAVHKFPLQDYIKKSLFLFHYQHTCCLNEDINKTVLLQDAKDARLKKRKGEKADGGGGGGSGYCSRKLKIHLKNFYNNVLRRIEIFSSSPSLSLFLFLSSFHRRIIIKRCLRDQHLQYSLTELYNVLTS